MSPAPLLSVASAVLWWQVLAAVVAGGLVGWVSGIVAVRIERIEKLEEEENEEIADYEREQADARAKAVAAGDDPPEFPPFERESYGRTWLEAWLSPALGALLFGGFTLHQGVGRVLFIHLLWVTFFVHIVAFDLKHRLILNVVTYPMLVLALAMSAVTPGLGPGAALAGAVICWFFFFVQSVVTRGGIGLGDAKLGAVIGAVCGINIGAFQFGAIYALTYGVFLGGAVAVVLLALRVRRLKDPIPYGPFLCAGAALVLYIYF